MIITERDYIIARIPPPAFREIGAPHIKTSKYLVHGEDAPCVTCDKSGECLQEKKACRSFMMYTSVKPRVRKGWREAERIPSTEIYNSI
jgi:hypothetical protein